MTNGLTNTSNAPDTHTLGKGRQNIMCPNICIYIHTYLGGEGGGCTLQQRFTVGESDRSRHVRQHLDGSIGRPLERLGDSRRVDTYKKGKILLINYSCHPSKAGTETVCWCS